MYLRSLEFGAEACRKHHVAPLLDFATKTGQPASLTLELQLNSNSDSAPETEASNWRPNSNFANFVDLEPETEVEFPVERIFF